MNNIALSSVCGKEHWLALLYNVSRPANLLLSHENECICSREEITFFQVAHEAA